MTDAENSSTTASVHVHTAAKLLVANAALATAKRQAAKTVSSPYVIQVVERW